MRGSFEFGTYVGMTLYQMRQAMQSEHKALVRQIVTLAVGVARGLDGQVQAGLLTEAEAKARAKFFIAKIRYGQDGYLFIYDTKGVNVLHPLYPEFEGQDRLDLQDQKGVAYIRDMIDKALTGGGFTQYHFPKPGDDQAPAVKIAYSQLYAPWKWVISTGLYEETLNHLFNERLFQWGLAAGIPVLLFSGILFFLARTLARPMADLERALREAESATRAKSDFLANMSHEIRTPLNGAMGMLSLLLGTKLSSQQREWAQVAQQSCEELLNLINDILDISKVESGKLSLEKTPFDLQSTVKSVTDLLYPRAHRKGVEILAAFQPDLPGAVMGDPVRLRQILLNLVSNAVKFTSKGYIFISLEGQAHQGIVRLKFEIKDTGIGIPADKIDYIFEKFSQAEESTTRNFGGTGLGLAICKKLTKLMGGDVGVRSQLGHGSTFWFTVIFEQIPNALSVGGAGKDHQGLSVLVGATHDMIRHALVSDLSVWGLKVDWVALGQGPESALQQATILERPFDILIFDTDTVGADPQTIQNLLSVFFSVSPRTRVILLASPDKLFSAEDIVLPGDTGLLFKPVMPFELYQMIGQMKYVRPSGRGGFFVTIRPDFCSLAGTGTEPFFGAPLPEAPAERPIKARVLVAEDQAVNQILMRNVLGQMGCAVDLAANGVEAVRLAAENVYDLVFMDGHMPEMDGLEATKQIRAFEEHVGRHVPIVALTADAMKGDREKCLDAGMDDYLHKPVRAESLRKMLEIYTAPRTGQSA